MSDFTIIPFDPEWDTRTIPGIGKLFTALEEGNLSVTSSRVVKQSVVILTYCADKHVLSISFLQPPSRTIGISQGNTLTYSATRNLIIKTRLIGKEFEETVYRRYIDTTGRDEWFETYTNKPRTKLNIANWRIPASRTALRDELLDNLNRQIRTHEFAGRRVPKGLQNFHDAVGSWSVEDGDITVKERRNYFSNAASVDVVLGHQNFGYRRGYHRVELDNDDSDPSKAVAEAVATLEPVVWPWGELDHDSVTLSRVFAALDPLTKIGTTALSALYHNQAIPATTETAQVVTSTTR